MKNLILKEILTSLSKKEIEVDKAYKLITDLFEDKPVKSSYSGDFRDPENYESQSERFGYK
jgi:hypothetical protein